MGKKDGGYLKIKDLKGIFLSSRIHDVKQQMQDDFKSVQQVYDGILKKKPKNVVWKTVWSKDVMPRHAFIFWLVLQGKLKTKAWLYDKGILDDGVCVLCKKERETVEHIFLACEYSGEVKKAVLDPLGLKGKYNDLEAWKTWCGRVLKGKTKLARRRRCVMAAMIYGIWRERNARVFRSESKRSEEIAKVVHDMEGWLI